MSSGVRSALNCSFLACRSGLRKCWHFILCHRPSLLGSLEEQYHVLCLGHSGSGKSVLLAELVGESAADLSPTNGFNIKTLPLNGIVLSIKELGGGDRVRSFWPHYYHEANHALLYVIDISASDLVFNESLDTLRKIAWHGELRDKPCMIIGTHVDAPGARAERDLVDILCTLLTGKRWKFHCCSIQDRSTIVEAFRSLATHIVAPAWPVSSSL